MSISCLICPILILSLVHFYDADFSRLYIRVLNVMFKILVICCILRVMLKQLIASGRRLVSQDDSTAYFVL